MMMMDPRLGRTSLLKRGAKRLVPAWAGLLLLASGHSSAAPQPVHIAPNSSFLLPVPQASSTARAGTGEIGWLEGGLPGGDSFRAREMDRDLEFRMMRALSEAEARGLTGQSSAAARRSDFYEMKKLAREALSIVERSQLEWHRRRVSGNLRKSMSTESARTIEDSVAMLGGVAAAGLGAPIRLRLLPSLELESKTHLLERTGSWRLLTPVGSSRVQVKFFDVGSQLEASHSYPLSFLDPRLSASFSAMRMLDGASIPGLIDDERLQLNYTIRF